MVIIGAIRETFRSLVLLCWSVWFAVLLSIFPKIVDITVSLMQTPLDWFINLIPLFYGVYIMVVWGCGVVFMYQKELPPVWGLTDLKGKKTGCQKSGLAPDENTGINPE